MSIARSLVIALVVALAAGVLDGCASARSTAVQKHKKRGRRAPVSAANDAADGAVASSERLAEALDAGEVELTDAVDEGLVSYYHDSLAGNPTANGERYRLAGATCAHKTLPFGTIVVIEDTATGKLATCRVNDRGPFVKGRVLDVSKRVARDLGLLDRGVIRARLRLIIPTAA